MEESDIIGEFNAKIWAQHFKSTYPRYTPDEDTLLGWFANAIMAGFDRGFVDGARFERESASEDVDCECGHDV